MIPAVYYEYIYMLIVTILTLYMWHQYIQYSWNRLLCPPDKHHIAALMLTVLLILFIGFRPVSDVFVDMVSYSRSYQFYKDEPFVFDWAVENKLFDNLFLWMASVGFDQTIWFTIIAAIYFGGIYVACRKMFPRDTLFALLVYLAAFSTFSYATNGIKAGAAASLFLVALAYRDKKWVSYLFIALSWGFHHSMQILVVAYIIVSLLKKTKYYLWIWCGSLLLAAMHVTFFQELFAGFTDEQGASYLIFDDTDSDYLPTTFRLDFIMYSAMPVLLGGYWIFKRGLKSEKYNFLYNIYLLANSVWLLCMYANFTNRIAYLSWQLLPIVLIYPFLNERISPSQYRMGAVVALAHLAFTLFMELVYF